MIRPSRITARIAMGTILTLFDASPFNRRKNAFSSCESRFFMSPECPVWVSPFRCRPRDRFGEFIIFSEQRYNNFTNYSGIVQINLISTSYRRLRCSMGVLGWTRNLYGWKCGCRFRFYEAGPIGTPDAGDTPLR